MRCVFRVRHSRTEHMFPERLIFMLPDRHRRRRRRYFSGFSVLFLNVSCVRFLFTFCIIFFTGLNVGNSERMHCVLGGVEPMTHDHLPLIFLPLFISTRTEVRAYIPTSQLCNACSLLLLPLLRVVFYYYFILKVSHSPVDFGFVFISSFRFHFFFLIC